MQIYIKFSNQHILKIEQYLVYHCVFRILYFLYL